MANVLTESPPLQTLADLLARLGDIPPGRVRLHPFPGTATEKDVIEAERREDRLCELVDGVLVEKAMGYDESELAMLIGHFLLAFVRPRKLGSVTGADGTVRLMPGLVRIPDVAFVSRERLRGRKRPKQPIPDLVPDLAVEVISKTNTRKEMERKLGEYFSVGVRLVWYVDPKTRTVKVYTGVGRKVVLSEDQTLDGGDVLPGFALPLREIFPPSA
jgi:Uma2 family endonuclease